MMTNTYMTPEQWGALRNLIREVLNVASRRLDMDLMMRAMQFIVSTRGYDV